MTRAVLTLLLLVLVGCAGCAARRWTPSRARRTSLPPPGRAIDYHAVASMDSSVRNANAAGDRFRFEYHWDAEHEEFDRDGLGARTFHVLAREAGTIRAEWWAHYLEPFVLVGHRVVRVSYDIAGTTQVFVHDLEMPEQGWTIKILPIPIDATIGAMSGGRGYTSRDVFILKCVRDDLVRIRTGPYHLAEFDLDLRERRLVVADGIASPAISVDAYVRAGPQSGAVPRGRAYRP